MRRRGSCCAIERRFALALLPKRRRATLYRMEKAGRFPRSTYISPNRRVWFEDEIAAWQNAVDEFDPHRRRGKGRRPGRLKLNPRKSEMASDIGASQPRDTKAS